MRHDEQLLTSAPVHVLQSGWQLIQVPSEENVPAGHLSTHLPEEANNFPVQERHLFEAPAQVTQGGKHSIQPIVYVSRYQT